jgi:hypothetical protein
MKDKKSVYNKRLIIILIAWIVGSGIGWLVAEYAIRAV